MSLANPCPVCLALPLDRCRTLRGQATDTHAARRDGAGPGLPPVLGRRHYRTPVCRCTGCYPAQRRARLRAAPTPDHVHGSATGYRDYGCRCRPCTAAVAADKRSRASGTTQAA